MKRSIFFMLALAAACFGVAVGTNLIEFSSDRTERRAIILSVGAVVGLAALGFGSSESEHEIDETTSGRATAARRLQSARPDPETLPSKPGSLLKKRAEAESAHGTGDTGGLDMHRLDMVESKERTTASPITEIGQEIAAEAAPFTEPAPVDTDADEFEAGELEADVDDADDDTAIAHAETVEETAADDPVSSTGPQRVIVPVATAETAEVDLDHALLELIDDEQMLEISDLVAAAQASAEQHTDGIVPATDTVEPLKRLELRLADYDDDDLARVVKESEAVVIAEMVRTGQLTSEGELTPQDIASMVFLAYTSEEMLQELRLRKSMDLSLPVGDIDATMTVEESR